MKPAYGDKILCVGGPLAGIEVPYRQTMFQHAVYNKDAFIMKNDEMPEPKSVVGHVHTYSLDSWRTSDMVMFYYRLDIMSTADVMELLLDTYKKAVEFVRKVGP